MQRWVKFVKHFRAFGWEPVIFTPENPSVGEQDSSLATEIPDDVEIIRFPVFEVQRLFGKAENSNRLPSEKSLFSSLKSKFGNFIRGNFFIPDARVTWVKPSVKFLTQYIKNHQIDAIVSSGPPHSMHLIALQLKKTFNIPWLSDFRDPWMEILAFHGFSTSAFAVNRHRHLFHEVIQKSDSIVVAHPTIRHQFQSLTQVPVTDITNGYDQEDFNAPIPAEASRQSNQKLRFVFVGILYDILNSDVIWKSLGKIVRTNKDFRDRLELMFVGKVHEAAMKCLHDEGLLPYCVFTGYVSHRLAVGYERTADALLLLTPAKIEYRYVIPGKLFEYMATGKPVICFANEENDAAQIIKRAKVGIVLHPEDEAAITSAFLDIQQVHSDKQEVEKYERKYLTARMVGELNRISG